MQVNITLSDDVSQLIKDKVEATLDMVVNEVLEECVDEIIKDVVRKQLKSNALIYLQSPELRRQLSNKVVPLIDSVLGDK